MPLMRSEHGPASGVDSASIMVYLHDPANVQQTSSECIQNTRANAGRLLDRVNTPLLRRRRKSRQSKHSVEWKLN